MEITPNHTSSHCFSAVFSVTMYHTSQCFQYIPPCHPPLLPKYSASIDCWCANSLSSRARAEIRFASDNSLKASVWAPVRHMFSARDGSSFITTPWPCLYWAPESKFSRGPIRLTRIPAFLLPHVTSPNCHTTATQRSNNGWLIWLNLSFPFQTEGELPDALRPPEKPAAMTNPGPPWPTWCAKPAP